ncbi:hypothetical protein ACQR10_19520 [Bradyrhizobium sp. HKCCYLRH2060]|uniref:hypothetical protein n=1 Tax=Bradyrhizobium TaxID=374 RepID=UPI0028EAD764|nr:MULTISPECIES: hypothetical protein [unclassified Bradyrhizobium]
MPENQTRGPHTINLTLHPDAVAAPAHRAAMICREVVDLYFDALSKADLSQPPVPPEDTFFRFSISGPEMSAEHRRGVHERWILSRAFQDLMRGVRASLEEAYFFIELFSLERIVAPSSGTLDEVLMPYRAKAQKLNFPDLMAYVNSALDSPVAFSEAYRSLQAARNCLEHRGGIVGLQDLDSSGLLKISVPRLKAFIEKDGVEIELFKNFYVEQETVLQMRAETRDLVFRLGQPLLISASDFEDIAYACANFGTLLAQQLPKTRSNS